MVEVIDELENRGWARRQKSDKDRRRHLLFITDEGDAVLRQIIADQRLAERRMLDSFPAEDLEPFLLMLERLQPAAKAALGNLRSSDLPPPAHQSSEKVIISDADYCQS